MFYTDNQLIKNRAAMSSKFLIWHWLTWIELFQRGQDNPANLNFLWRFMNVLVYEYLRLNLFNLHSPLFIDIRKPDFFYFVD